MSELVQPTYFTCTLGEASRWKETHPKSRSFSTVIDLIDRQAADNPQLPAVGFSNIASAQAKNRGSHLTFRELHTQSLVAASQLAEILPQRPKSKSIGLLCTSSLDFVRTWLGLTRLGCSVLLLAPQLEGQAIHHLCKSLSVETVFTDARQEGRCTSIREHITIIRIPTDAELKAMPNGACLLDLRHAPKKVSGSDVALWFHSSGTSTGLPKAIPQTHGGLVAALPSFPGLDKPATFSTTPLYHGGLVDALRAWSSGAMIWFFPEGEAPITWTNVRNAVAHARQTNVARIGYFSSVPYILQMLSDETAGLELLESMDLVGVGGAALPEVTGDNLVRHGVHLLSRMGSAECGFLMSSHRDYPNDKDWQFLRPVRDASLLAFEPRDDGLLELVVKPKWPHLAKINRRDGSYATSDLFEPHPQESGLWRYHSRADAQITLSNGKKFDPSPLEASILASTSLLTDVLIFGNGRGHPGLLLLPCVQESPQDVVKSIWPIVESLNAGSQNHARIAKSMLVVAEPAGQPGLEKNSKGTVLRRQAEARFAEDIERAYSQPKAGVVLSDTASYDELRSIVINCFTQVLGRAVNISKDLYGQGVDSISCIQIRGMIQNSCLPVDSGALPLNVLYDKGTVDSLVSYLWHLRQDSSSGNTPNDVDLNEAQNLQTMTDLAAEYTRTLLWSSLPDMTSGETVVLTGSTGFLGSHILRLLLMDNQMKQVICLIRGSSAAEVQNRLEATLRHRGCSDLLDQRVLCAPCNLSREDLGLTTELRSLLAAKAALYIHSAWTVNFSLHISSFEDQIRGTANMLKLAAQSGAQMVFISSTAAVSHARHSGTIHEIISTDPKDASPLGYSQSKWVAEQICAAAADRQGPSGSSTPRCPILIVRVGQLCGDERGVWNESEAYPLMLSTARITGSLPAIEGEVANWMPVHLAARAVIDIALQSGENGSLRQSNIFHVLNHHNTPSWEQMLRWLQEDNNSNVSGASFELQPASRWVSALEAAAQKGGKQHPAYALLGLWKNAFESAGSFSDDPVVLPRCFDTARSQQVSPVMRSLQPLDREQLVRMWRWVNHTLP